MISLAYKKNISYLFIVFICLLFSGCVSTHQPEADVLEPKWISNQGRKEIFPDSEFVSNLSYGNSEEECKEKAAVGISEYIKASIESSTNAGVFYNEAGNVFTEKRTLQKNIQISTANNIYQLEYTNPYFDVEHGQFACVAYINREKAFSYVRPKLEIAKAQFPENYNNALKKDSELEKIIGIRRSWTVLQDFYEVYDFARAVMPSKSRAYEEIDFLASKSLITIKELASSIVIKIQGAGDSALLESSGVITELSNQLSKLGFVPGNSRKTDYSALVEVRSVITKTAETYQTYPEISIRLMEKGNEKVTYIKNLPKVAGFDKETVIRRTAIALTEDIKKSFIKECF